jgi:hypothetical protein
VAPEVQGVCIDERSRQYLAVLNRRTSGEITQVDMRGYSRDANPDRTLDRSRKSVGGGFGHDDGILVGPSTVHHERRDEVSPRGRDLAGTSPPRWRLTLLQRDGARLQ